jgi:hypothetical protein
MHRHNAKLTIVLNIDTSKINKKWFRKMQDDKLFLGTIELTVNMMNFYNLLLMYMRNNR